MGDFKYQALSASGEKILGVVEAADQFEAVAKIKQTCPIILEIEEVGAKAEKNLFSRQKISTKNLSLLCNRFATLLKVGLPIVETVDMLARQMDDRDISRILKEVSKDVSMGRSLYSSFAAHKGVFPATFLESIRSGEESGDLEQTFQRMHVYYERSSKTTQKVTSALLYPAFTLVVAVVVIAIIMTYAVPTFAKTFSSMNTEMPAITLAVIGISNFFVKYGLFVLAGIIAAVIVSRVYIRTEKGAETFSVVALAIPFLGKIIQLSSASQFAHTMSMMIASGMPILNCIETAGKGVGNYVMRRDIVSVTDEVESGKSLGSCLAKSKYLPPMLVEMTAMGESTGTLEMTLDAVGNFYDNEVDIATSRAMSILEPTLICILAVVVVVILFSVYLPMFNMYGGA